MGLQRLHPPLGPAGIPQQRPSNLRGGDKKLKLLRRLREHEKIHPQALRIEEGALGPPIEPPHKQLKHNRQYIKTLIFDIVFLNIKINLLE